MANLTEIQEALRTIRGADGNQLALLKCTSAYPAPYDEINLRTIPYLEKTFLVPIGLSDHTLGISVPVAAVALGACIIEKHFTLSRNSSSPDSPFSLEPKEFNEMVSTIRNVEKALGKVSFEVSHNEKKSYIFRRSLFFVEDVKMGETITTENVRSIRPGHGIAPKYYYEILGYHVKQDITRGTPVSWDLIAEYKK